jgi:hypothetical protein
MMAEGVDEASDAPAVRLIGNGPHDDSSCSNGSIEYGIGVGDGQDHPDRTAANGFGAEIGMLGGFIGNPEFRALHGQMSNDIAFLILNAHQFRSAESVPVKFKRTRATANGKQRRDGGWFFGRSHFNEM